MGGNLLLIQLESRVTEKQSKTGKNLGRMNRISLCCFFPDCNFVHCICQNTKSPLSDGQIVTSSNPCDCNALAIKYVQYKKLLSLLHFFHCLHNPNYTKRRLFGLVFSLPFIQLMSVCSRNQNIHVNDSLTGTSLTML